MILQAAEIENAVKNCKGLIIITTHHKPDADALGSSLGLYHALKSEGKVVHVITPTDFPKFLDWMPGRDLVINFEEEKSKAQELTESAEIVFCLDFNDLKRINEYGDIVENSDATKVMIDHHQEPKDFAKLQYHTIETSSTCELVYQWLSETSLKQYLNEEIASCLYAGIMTDTGGFRHGNTSSKTFRIAAELMDLGANNVSINQAILDQHSLRRFKLIGYSLFEKLRLLENNKVAILSLSSDELQQFNVKTGDTEGLVNYGLSISGVELSVLIIDRSVRVKMSFRSKTHFPCNQFAKEFFSGGGHYNAAGGQSELTLDETILKFENSLKQYNQWLE
jgi:phosphoesterase RecJ-like protein